MKDGACFSSKKNADETVTALQIRVFLSLLGLSLFFFWATGVRQARLSDGQIFLAVFSCPPIPAGCRRTRTQRTVTGTFAGSPRANTGHKLTKSSRRERAASFRRLPLVISTVEFSLVSNPGVITRWFIQSFFTGPFFSNFRRGRHVSGWPERARSFSERQERSVAKGPASQLSNLWRRRRRSSQKTALKRACLFSWRFVSVRLWRVVKTFRLKWPWGDGGLKGSSFFTFGNRVHAVDDEVINISSCLTCFAAHQCLGPAFKLLQLIASSRRSLRSRAALSIFLSFSPLSFHVMFQLVSFRGSLELCSVSRGLTHWYN